MNTERRQRKARAASERILGAPLYVVTGVAPHLADEVERRARRLLGLGLGGDVFVPRVRHLVWYSPEEADEVFRLAAAKVIEHSETAQEQPTPSAVFLLFVKPSAEAMRDALLAPFEFWAWPEELKHESDSGYLPPVANGHWSRQPQLVAEAIAGASRRLHAQESDWSKLSKQIRSAKTHLRLPPVNFRFPEHSQFLADVYRAHIRGADTIGWPRLHRVGPGTHQIRRGDQHFRDACGRFFPFGGAPHGSLRELDAERRGNNRVRRVWLNGAYRFGCWIGDLHEHFDAQPASGNFSPPDAFCSLRNQWVHVPRGYVNVFGNDFVRDGDLFA